MQVVARRAHEALSISGLNRECKGYAIIMASYGPNDQSFQDLS